MHRHPQNIPVVEYYELNGVNFTYCWRAGCTSIAALALNNNAKVLEDAPETCVLLLKHPLERFRSAYMILPEGRVLNDKTGLFERGLPPMEDFLNGTLDDVEGVRSPHTWGQIEQHKAVKALQLFKLEGSTHLAGVELPYLNRTEVEKPDFSQLPRFPELAELYAEDIEAWNSAQPLTNLIYPAGVGM